MPDHPASDISIWSLPPTRSGLSASYRLNPGGPGQHRPRPHSTDCLSFAAEAVSEARGPIPPRVLGPGRVGAVHLQVASEVSRNQSATQPGLKAANTQVPVSLLHACGVPNVIVDPVPLPRWRTEPSFRRRGYPAVTARCIPLPNRADSQHPRNPAEQAPSLAEHPRAAAHTPVATIAQFWPIRPSHQVSFVRGWHRC